MKLHTEISSSGHILKNKAWTRNQVRGQETCICEHIYENKSQRAERYFIGCGKRNRPHERSIGMFSGMQEEGQGPLWVESGKYNKRASISTLAGNEDWGKCEATAEPNGWWKTQRKWKYWMPSMPSEILDLLLKRGKLEKKGLPLGQTWFDQRSARQT